MRVLLTGATGFVGAAVHERLRLMPEVSSIRLLVREDRPAVAGSAGDYFRGDLTDEPSLAGITAGMDVVVHAASYVGADEVVATAVNDFGTAALVGECQRTATRIVDVSTTAIYGPGPHRLSREGELAAHPVSVASASRSAGESRTLGAGGKVVRAALTYGAGDRWFVPLALAGVRTSRGWVGGGGARLSTIHVSSLAAQVAALALRFDEIEESVFHAADPAPATFREIMTHVGDALGVALSDRDIPVDDPLLAHLPPQLLQRAYVDHSYSGELLSARTGVQAQGGVRLTQADLDWYATTLQA
ncbi:hypothetical protein C5B85_16810 [Pseudoclavibacter sp. AY1F1]|uniref:NAD-dependent epimerase/dehydratase family protein n=1 Tax=Pseudoclavibacter sp. AY1F1 TaxID=2080583 RepID=UPI000CE7BD45|nr:NAD(P)-dependent oxidoreductase [Pseudoclavibacter sp. AY1F1]PPF42210.1 hypothetical protein C5B85_16810 [Pseudoclavibacter sp. AY1F1]